MTEKQLRDGLQEHLAPAEFPDCRREALLRQLRTDAAPSPAKGEKTMFRPNKFRTILIAALILTLLSATVAVASGYTGFVNFKGQPVEDPLLAMPTPIPTNTPRPGELTQDAFNELAGQVINANPQYMVNVIYSSPEIIEKRYAERGTGHDKLVTFSTMEEAAALVGDILPLPNIPEGFAIHHGYVTLVCSAEGAYELVSESTTPEGVIIRLYDVPAEAAVPTCLHMTLKNDKGDLIDCIVDLSHRSATIFDVAEGDVVQTPAVPDMDDAIVITGAGRNRLDMRRKLDDVIYVLYSWGSYEEDFYTYFYDMLEFRAESETVPAEVLLSLFN